MFESSCYIFIEMEYIAGEQLKKIYDRRLSVARNQLGEGYNEEEVKQRQLAAMFKQQ